MALKDRLADFCTDPKHLQEMYQAFPDYAPHSIRGRLNENIDKAFKRISKGVYMATNGNAKALIVEGDSWAEIKKLHDSTIDTIITDSGYTVLNKFVATGTTRHKTNKWDFATKDIDEELLTEMNRVLKPGGHAFFFLPSDSGDTLQYNDNFIRMARREGFQFNKRFIWDKMCIGMGYNGRCKYEQILFFSKGRRHKPYDLAVPDLLTHKRISPKQRVHEAEKPVELIKDLLRFSTRENEICLDPFAGSFSTAKACLEMNINAVGFDINPEYIEHAVRELGAKPVSLNG